MKISERISTSAAHLQRKSASFFFSPSTEQEQPFFEAKGTRNTASFFKSIAPLSKNVTIQTQSNTIQRMANCPEHLEDAQSTPAGWHDYVGSGLGIFHCGFRTILENRAPTPDDPMNECVYDHSGNLVNASHPYAGCRGTPDQYDGHSGTPFQKFMHTACDTGGIVAQGIPAFITSRRHDIDEAIRASETIPSILKPVLIGTNHFLLEVIARLAVEARFLPIRIRIGYLCALINLILLTIRLGRDITDFFRRLTTATLSGWEGIVAFISAES
jgi:hypothetical protein